MHPPRTLPNPTRLPWTALVAALLLVAGCGKWGTEAPQGGTTIPPSQAKLKRNVELAVAQCQALTYFVETVGYLEAESLTSVSAGVSGVVDEVLFREGDWVTENTVLAKIDQKRYQAGAEVARANEKRAEGSVALARDQADRARRIIGSGLTEEERARAALTLRVAEAELLSAKAGRDLAEHNLEKSQVRAPYAGQINQRLVTPGSYLEEKGAVATMADLRRLRLVGYVPEKAAPLVRELLDHEEQLRSAQRIGGMFGSRCLCGGLAAILVTPPRSPGSDRFALEFTLTAYPRHTFHAHIFYMSTVANPETHMFECKAEVEDVYPGVELRPGYTARIKVPLQGNPNACVIPEESVRASERGFIAFVPEQRTGRDGSQEWVARARQLRLGFRSAGTVEVLQGITPGEQIVRKGAESLEEGTPINVVNGSLGEK